MASHAPFRCIASTLLLVTIRSVSKCNKVKVPINDKKVTSLLVTSSHQSSYFVTSKSTGKIYLSNVTRYFYFVTEQVWLLAVPAWLAAHSTRAEPDSRPHLEGCATNTQHAAQFLRISAPSYTLHIHWHTLTHSLLSLG